MIVQIHHNFEKQTKKIITNCYVSVLVPLVRNDTIWTNKTILSSEKCAQFLVTVLGFCPFAFPEHPSILYSLAQSHKNKLTSQGDFYVFAEKPCLFMFRS